MSRRAPAAAAVAALALAPVACGGSGPRPRPEPTPRPTATATPPRDPALLQQALDLRAARTTAGPARRLGVRDIRLAALTTRVQGDRATLGVRMSYRVTGLAGSFGGTRTMTARRAGGGWRLAPPGGRDRAPWEADRYRRASTRHFVLWMPRGLDPAPLRAALEAGYDRMRHALERGTLRRRYLVVVARDARRAVRLTSRIRGLTGLTALTDTQVRQAGASEQVQSVASQRLLVIWPAFMGLAPADRRMTIAHELTHAALAPVSSGRVPGWLSEGLAMYVSGDRRIAVPAVGVTLRRLSAPDALAKLRGSDQAAAYALASRAAYVIAERYGRRRLLDLYDAFNRADVRGATAAATVDSALRRVLHTSLRRLDGSLG